jgi:hypothetical protein
MKEEYKYWDQQFVHFDNGVVKGNGIIVGCAIIGHPLIGKTYIIQVHQCEPQIPNETYPFRTIPMTECHISPYNHGQTNVQ